MGKKLTIWLPDHWANVSHENPDGPLTMCWDDAAACGAFQLSTAEYKGGKEPRTSEPELVQFAVAFGERHGWGELISSCSGKCKMGSFGTAAFKPTEPIPPDDPAFSQVWFITNGWDFVLATFIAMQPPEQQELDDAHRIAEGIDLSE